MYLFGTRTISSHALFLASYIFSKRVFLSSRQPFPPCSSTSTLPLIVFPLPPLILPHFSFSVPCLSLLRSCLVYVYSRRVSLSCVYLSMCAPYPRSLFSTSALNPRFPTPPLLHSFPPTFSPLPLSLFFSPSHF